jgi:hypothetical protein
MIRAGLMPKLLERKGLLDGAILAIRVSGWRGDLILAAGRSAQILSRVRSAGRISLAGVICSLPVLSGSVAVHRAPDATHGRALSHHRNQSIL